MAALGLSVSVSSAWGCCRCITAGLRWYSPSPYPIFAAFGIERITVDDSLTELFRADTPDFKQYERLSSRFPSSEYDVLVVVEGPTLLERQSLEALRDTVIELQFVPGMQGLISIFSARASPEPGRLPAPLFPETLPEGRSLRAAHPAISRQNRIIAGKLLSDDGQLTLIVVALDRRRSQTGVLDDAIREIKETTIRHLAGTGLSAQLAGAPVMQLEIRNAVQRDRIVYNGLGFLIGVVIAMVFFRHFSFMAIAAVPPAIAILWSLGTLGWMDFRLNLFLNVISPLTMVMGFADSMQMTFALRDRMLAGDSRLQAIRLCRAGRRPRLFPQRRDGGALLHRAHLRRLSADPDFRHRRGDLHGGDFPRGHHSAAAAGGAAAQQ